MNKILFNISAVFVIVVIASCSRTYLIPEEYLDLIPYKQGDELIFRSNNGVLDTLFVVDVDSFISSNDPLGINADKEETYVVLTKKDRSSSFVNKLLSLTATEDNGIVVKLFFVSERSHFYGKKSFTVSELNDKEVLTQKINGNLYRDIWLFQATEREFEERANFIERLYWSKAEGVVKYEKSNNDYWEIVR